MRSSTLLRGIDWASALQRWQQLNRAPPLKRQEQARRLLAETVACVDPEAATNGSSSNSGSALLGDRASSTLIWQTLRRQQIPWKETLALLTHQCAQFSPEQADVVRRYSAARPAQHSLAVLRAWERVEDAGLVSTYHDLKRATSVVAYAKIVSSALRSRPHLRGVLPVTRAALERLYDLAGAVASSGSDGAVAVSDTARGPGDAVIALRLCGHLALLASASLSARDKEALDLSYAGLQARAGDWAAALSTVEHGPKVRASRKVAWRAFVRTRHMWAKALESLVHSSNSGDGHGGVTAAVTTTTPQYESVTQIKAAVLAAPHWQQALMLVEATNSAHQPPPSLLHEAAVTAFLSRRDACGPHCALSWSEQVTLFLRIAPQRQSFAQARAVLAAVPQKDPLYLCTAATVLRGSAMRMYAGTLARRYHGALRSGDWGFALALSLASDGFDLAAQTMTAAPSVAETWGSSSGYQQPAAWVCYQNTTHALLKAAQGDAREAAAAVILATDCGSSRRTTDSERAAVLLAVALHTDEAWRDVLANPLTQQHARLRSYVTARQLQMGGDIDGDAIASLRQEVGCFLFARPSDTELVFSWAPEKAQTYFLKVLPPSLRASLRPSHAHRATGPTQDESPAVRTHTEIPPPTLSEGANPDDGLKVVLREMSATGGDAPTSVAHRLAHLAASGALAALPTPCRSGVALAALSAPPPSQCAPGLDGSAVLAAARMAVALRLPHPAVMQRGIAAHLLLGQWERALHELARWRGHLHDAGQLAQHASRVMETTRLCALQSPSSAALPLVDAALKEAALWTSDANASPASLQMQTALLEGVLDLLTTPPDTRQMEVVLSQCAHRKRTTPEVASVRKHALSSAFCLLNDESSLSRVLRAAGQTHVGVLDLDDHAAQRLILALPLTSAIAALTTLTTHQRPVHEHWIMVLLAKCPLPQAAEDSTSSVPVLRTLRHFQPHSLPVSAIFTAKMCVANDDLRGCLQALNRLLDLLLCVRHGDGAAQRARVRRRLAPHAVTSLVYVLRDILVQCVGDEKLRTCTESEAIHVREEALKLYHTLCREPHLSHALLQRDEGLVASLTRRACADHAATRSLTQVARALLLLGYVHRVLARDQRIPIAAAMTSSQLHLCCTSCPEEWQVGLHLFQQLRSPRLQECEALFTILAHAPGDVGAQASIAERLVLPPSPLIRMFPEQALIWGPRDDTAPTGSALQWHRALHLLHAHHAVNGPVTSASAEAFKRDLETLVRELSECERAAVCDCLQRAHPTQHRHTGVSSGHDWVRDYLLTTLRRPPHHSIT